MASAQLASISNRLTSAQAALLERSRVLSLGMVPSASTTTQLVRSLTNVKRDLGKIADEAELERAGLVVGTGGGAGKTSRLDEEERAIEEMWGRYDRAVEMLGKDEDGRERAKALVRERRPPSPMEEDIPSPTGGPLRSPLRSHTPSPEPRDEPVRPFRDYDEDEEEQDERGMLSQQQLMMNEQDDRLTLLSHSINRQNHLSVQIGDELDQHHELLEDTDAAMDRTAARLNRARRRLDTVAESAKQHGSTITIVALIVILLFLIIIFKT